MTTDTHHRRFHIRWWHLAIAAIVLLIAALITTAYAWRAVGRGQYLTVVERLHALGKPATIDDYVALAPAVDRSTQDAWDAWQKLRVSSPSTGSVEFSTAVIKHQKAWDAWVIGQGPRPDELATLIATTTPEFADAVQVLRKGNLVLSGLGWIAQDLPVGKRRMPFTAAIRQPSLLTVRELTMWLHHATVLAENPRQHLADLDALIAAMARPATLIDAMIAIAIGDIRDRTYVELMLMGRLPDDARLRWLAEESHCLTAVRLEV